MFILFYFSSKYHFITLHKYLKKIKKYCISLLDGGLAISCLVEIIRYCISTELVCVLGYMKYCISLMGGLDRLAVSCHVELIRLQISTELVYVRLYERFHEFTMNFHYIISPLTVFNLYSES